ncbi:hypothetical protein NDN08_007643 [Rhodosorus marinus]|uniref:N-alpha-acetyltransferase 40 n=1 Tax=Rhodosorus marinus TaxID=101924 RepID=A0AAV8V1Q1_9RHOD|nr:hypothetical protein NDN08_007643 [Rhodosorus marinus]
MSPKKRNPAGSTARQVVNEAYKKGSKDVVERVTCQVYSRRELAEKTLSWAFSMVELNVKEFYGDSWSPREKQRELKSDHAQFIFVRVVLILFPALDLHEDDRGVRDGFASFRFCVEDDEAILYIYELQVDEKVRGKGIGKHMLKLLEEVAAHMKMSKVILTVHKSNERAIAFYRSQG